MFTSKYHIYCLDNFNVMVFFNRHKGILDINRSPWNMDI